MRYDTLIAGLLLFGGAPGARGAIVDLPFSIEETIAFDDLMTAIAAVDPTRHTRDGAEPNSPMGSEDLWFAQQGEDAVSQTKSVSIKLAPANTLTLVDLVHRARLKRRAPRTPDNATREALPSLEWIEIVKRAKATKTNAK